MKRSDLDLRGYERGQVKTFCPRCHATRKHQSDPSLQVNLDTGGYTCHNCDIQGYLEGTIRSPYVSKTRKEYKVPTERSLRTEEPDPQVMEYFRNRGISEKTLADWRISYGPSFPVLDFEAPKTEQGKFRIKRDEDGLPIIHRGIQFPYFEGDALVNVKYLRPREWSEDGERMFKSFPGGKPLPFGFNRASGRIVLFEGEIDALSGYEAGIPESWSIPGGAKSFEWLDLDGVVQALLAAGDIYLALDSDTDGRACRDELIRRLSLLVGPERLHIVDWPPDCKDANDVLVKYGPERLKELVEQESRPVPIDGISEVTEFVDEYLDFYDNGVPKGISTGIASDDETSPLDEIYRVMEGMFTIISGVTNYGKSELVDEMVRCMIQKFGWKFAFYTPENSPLPLHMMKIAEKYIGKPYDRTRNGFMSRDEAVEAAEWMKDNFFYINPRNTIYTIDEILAKAEILVYRNGIQGLIIDPWNYVRKDFGGLREDQYINECMQKIGVFCKKTRVHVWLTVHPRTLRKDKDGKIELPSVMDLSGGSKFGDNCDFFFVVHRDPKEAFVTGIHTVSVHVQKSRYRYAAQQGAVSMEWNPFNGRFAPVGKVAKWDSSVQPIVVPPDEIDHVFSAAATSGFIEGSKGDSLDF